MTSASMIADLVGTLGLDEKTCEEFHTVYLNAKNIVVGIEIISNEL